MRRSLRRSFGNSTSSACRSQAPADCSRWVRQDSRIGVEFVANVALFVPIGIAFGLALPTRWWLAMLLSGPVLSAAIEVAQRELLSERYASVADVVANTVGATLGVGVALAVRASVAYRDRRLIARYEAQKHLLGSVP